VKRDTHRQNMLKYLMRLRLHVSVLVPLSDPRAKAKASERQGKARHLLYLFSEIDIATRGNQLLHRVRCPALRRSVERRASKLRERERGVVEEASGCGGYTHTHTHTHTYTHTHTHTHIMQVRYFPVI
jgi:hypothetical protein